MIAIKSRNKIEIEANGRGLVFIKEYSIGKSLSEELSAQIILRQEDVDDFVAVLMNEKVRGLKESVLIKNGAV